MCANNAAHKQTETVNAASAIAVPATCTEKGETTYTAAFTNPAFETKTRTVADIPALGHSAAEAVTENRVEPTCTEAGSCDTVVYCSVCGAELSRATKVLAPTGHAWGEAAYAWSADNGQVTATRVCAHDGGHTETETVNVTAAVTKPASCEGMGETTYTAAFGNPAFEAQTKTLADIPALGHTPGETVIENVTEPSGETDGCHDEAVYCMTCGRELSRRTVVDRALYISKQPEDQNVHAGETAVFTVTAVGENVTYRWQYSSNNGTSWNDCRSAGHDTDTFSFRMTAGLAGRLYRCVVSNDRLSATSEAAKLTRVVDAPVITVQPEDRNVNPGDRAAFTVTAEGEDLTYQWQISKDGGENWRDCTSAGNDAASFGFTAKASYSGWMYRCAVSNAGGSVTSEAVTLTVANGPVITKQPADRTAAPGETVTFTVEATGLNLTYQWQYSKDGGETWRSCTSKGYDTDTFTFAMTEGYGGRLYRCVLRDDTGTTRSSAAALILSSEGPAITAQPADQSVTAGQTAVFRIGTAGDGVTYQWQYSTNGGTSWNNCRSRGYDTDTFSFRMTAGLAGRLYRCLATDATGTRRSDAASLTLAAGPSITAHPKDQTVKAGAKATFTAAASGDGVTYQWQVSKDGGLTWKDCTSAGNKTASFGFTAKASYSGWMYRCAIGDANGSNVTDAALLTVNCYPYARRRKTARAAFRLLLQTGKTAFPPGGERLSVSGFPTGP